MHALLAIRLTIAIGAAMAAAYWASQALATLGRVFGVLTGIGPH